MGIGIQNTFVYLAHVIVCMARENTIVLSDSELQKLQDTRTEMFGSDEVPYGVVVDKLCSEYTNE
jgi:hypothetical protein